MALERTDELYKVLLDRGYPKEFCAEIAYKNMNTDYTATRMLGYLYRVSNPRTLKQRILARVKGRQDFAILELTSSNGSGNRPQTH